MPKTRIPLKHKLDRVGTVVFKGSGSRPSSVTLLFDGEEIDWDATLRPYGSGGWAKVDRVEDYNGDAISDGGQIQL